MKDCVLNRVEDEANVVGVNRHCEVVEERLALVTLQRFEPKPTAW